MWASANLAAATADEIEPRGGIGGQTLPTRSRGADLNLSPADADAVRRRAGEGCAVLGVRYTSDPLVGTRSDSLTPLLGDAFLRVEVDGKGHSTVTEHRSQEAVDAVLGFFGERLHA